MKSKAEKLKNNQIKLTITIPSDDVKKDYDHVLEEFAKDAEIKGFRKGHAPKELVIENIDKAKFNSHLLEHLISKSYSQAIKEHHLNPISQPKVTMKSFHPPSHEDLKGGTIKDMVYEAEIAQIPEVDFGDYKKALREVNKEIKKQSNKDTKTIYGPDGKPLKEERTKDESLKFTMSQVLEVLLKESKVEVPDLLVNQEVDRMLSRLIDQTQKLGVTVDQYLASVNKTSEELRKEYKSQAENNLKAEFILSKLAKEENISVTDKEIDDAIHAAPDQKSKDELQRSENRWYIKSVLTKNKTLRRLVEIAESK